MTGSDSADNLKLVRNDTFSLLQPDVARTWKNRRCIDTAWGSIGISGIDNCGIVSPIPSFNPARWHQTTIYHNPEYPMLDAKRHSWRSLVPTVVREFSDVISTHISLPAPRGNTLASSATSGQRTMLSSITGRTSATATPYIVLTTADRSQSSAKIWKSTRKNAPLRIQWSTANT